MKNKSLIIVESPGKIKTIQGIVGNDYIVRASIGHCFEIDPSEDGINMTTFEPNYKVINGKGPIINELKKLSKECEICYIATDGDREGEAIGYHIATMALDKKAIIKRASFQEITKSAILKALENPRELDEHLYHAQKARSVLDRIVGYKVSPFLWRYVASKTSAGRVQSIGLRLIVDRQQEIDAFKVEEYWSIVGDFLNSKKEKFQAEYNLKEKLKTKEETDKILDSIKESKKWIVKEVSQIKKDRLPFPLFQTSTLQQFCSSTFGWSAKKTMSIAQEVYEKGFITYHRTDCVNVSKEAITAVRTIIQEQYGNKYLPEKPNIYKSKASAQEAHEGIRPSHLELSLEDVLRQLGDDQSKLYEAIYRRFLACQMTKAVFNHTKITIVSNDNLHTFGASGQTIVFDGFLKVYPYSSSKETILPLIQENEDLKLEEVKGEQHFTKPPAAFNDASLIKTLEENGIGRPSTYASIIETLKRRTYVIDDHKKAFMPSELGKQVCAFLVKAFPELMNTNYTARIEEQLDEIANNKKQWVDVVSSFWIELEKCLKTSKDIGQEIRKDNVTDIVCPDCKKHHLVKRLGKFGAFYGCEGYRLKECSAIFKIGENGDPIKIEKKEVKYLEGHTCDKCGSKLIIRVSSRTGKEFCGCSSFPKCKRIFSIEGEPINFSKK